MVLSVVEFKVLKIIFEKKGFYLRFLSDQSFQIRLTYSKEFISNDLLNVSLALSLQNLLMKLQIFLFFLGLQLSLRYSLGQYTIVKMTLKKGSHIFEIK